MATTTEEFLIIQRIEGQDKVTSLKNEIDKAEESLSQMLATQRAMGSAGSQMTASINAQASALAGLQTNLQQAERGLAAVGGGGRSNGRALMEFSRAAEDAQFGLMGVLNNIPGLVNALGGGAGLVGVISLAAVGAYQLYKNWDSLTGALGGGIPQPALTGVELLTDNLKKASEEIETLGKKSSLTWFELQRLQKLQGDVKSFKQEQKDNTEFQGLMDGQSKGDQERGKAFKDALNEAGPKNAADELTGNLAEGKNAKGLVFNPVSRTFTTPEEASQDLILAASKGDQMAQDEIRNSLKKGSSFAAKIDENPVGAKEAAKEEEEYEKFRLKQEDDHQDKLAREQAAAAERTRRINEKVAEDQANDSAKAFEAEVKQATKSRSFLRKDQEEMTPAELLAEQDWKKQEAKIDEASRNRSWLTDDGMEKDDEALTPEEKMAKRRSDENDKRADKVRRDQMDAPGMGDFVKDALLSGFSDGAVASQLAALGIDAKGQDELLQDGRKGAYEQMLSDSEGQATNSQTLAGGMALRDAIQGGMKNEPDLLQKQLDRLGAMEGYLQSLAERRDAYTTTAVAG